ncbi:hypothetical protein ACJQWK_08479 [Exserohilum turcicum]
MNAWTVIPGGCRSAALLVRLENSITTTKDVEFLPPLDRRTPVTRFGHIHPARGFSSRPEGDGVEISEACRESAMARIIPHKVFLGGRTQHAMQKREPWEISRLFEDHVNTACHARNQDSKAKHTAFGVGEPIVPEIELSTCSLRG